MSVDYGEGPFLAVSKTTVDYEEGPFLVRAKTSVDYGKGPFLVQNLKLKRRFSRILKRY